MENQRENKEGCGAEAEPRSQVSSAELPHFAVSDVRRLFPLKRGLLTLNGRAEWPTDPDNAAVSVGWQLGSAAGSDL